MKISRAQEAAAVLEVLEDLLVHLRSLAMTHDPVRRIAVSRWEIELLKHRPEKRDLPTNVAGEDEMPQAVNFALAPAKPTEVKP